MKGTPKGILRRCLGVQIYSQEVFGCLGDGQKVSNKRFAPKCNDEPKKKKKTFVLLNDNSVNIEVFDGAKGCLGARDVMQKGQKMLPKHRN